MWDGGSMATVRALVGFCRPVAGVDDVGLRSVVGLMAVELPPNASVGCGLPGTCVFSVPRRRAGLGVKT